MRFITATRRWHRSPSASYGPGPRCSSSRSSRIFADSRRRASIPPVPPSGGPLPRPVWFQQGRAALPAAVCTTFGVQLLQRLREFGPSVASVRAAVETRLGSGHDGRAGHPHRASACCDRQVSVANAITSLRFCSELDWSDYFESVSLVEQVLRRDPAAVYGSMDFLSRDRYRGAVEALAEASGEAQLRVALRTIESARQAADSRSSNDRAAHVGYHLIGKGRFELETDVAYQPTLVARARRFFFAHATAVYLGAIAALTVVPLLARRYLCAQSADARTRCLPCCSCCRPASLRLHGATVPCAHDSAATAATPGLSAGIPAEARTMVVIPTFSRASKGLQVARASGGSRPGQQRSAHQLRHSQRFHGRARSGHA